MRLLLLSLCLFVISFLVGGMLASPFAERMHEVMPKFPSAFYQDFDGTDMAISMAYNFALWWLATLAFHLVHPQLSGGMVWRSVKSYGVMCAYLCSVTAVYMNHFEDAAKPFFGWSMAFNVVVFPIVAVANGLLYPRFFKVRDSQSATP